MTARREQQCFNDGREARGLRVPVDRCPLRGKAQRAAWLRGWEYEERLVTGIRATPAQRTESADVLRRLKEFATTL